MSEQSSAKYSDKPLPAGKLPAPLLTQLLATLPIHHPQLVLGPAVGEDAAVIDLEATDSLLVAKSDPITFATDEIGFYAVNVCANDLAVTGATPLFYLPTLLLPAATATSTMAAEIFHQIGQACQALAITVVGGHSEITPAVNQPVVAGTLLGTVPRKTLVASGGARPGDLLLMAGMAPIEGASIIAREMADELRQRGWTAAELTEAANYLHAPGISVLQPALTAAQSGKVSAMHDPTEGGIITGIQELAAAANVGIELDVEHIPISPLAARLCQAFDLDPLGTIASGALLATATAADAEPLLSAWAAEGWPATIIGRVTAPAQGIVARRAGKQIQLPTFAADEITKLFADAP